MFEIESKFCQNVKFFMTTVICEISDFDHFFNICQILYESKFSVPKWYSGELFSCSEWFLKVWDWVKILWKCVIFNDHGHKRNFRFWPLSQHSQNSHESKFWLSKLYSGELFSCSEWFLKVWGWVQILSKCEIFHDCGH